MMFSRRMSCLLLVWMMVSGAEGFAQGQDPTSVMARVSGGGRLTGVDILSYVDPFIGTGRSDVFTRWGNEGGTYPGAVAPWGMMQLTPETRATGGYDYGDDSLYFFSCFHHLSGYPGGSAGQIKIMPLGPSGGGPGGCGNDGGRGGR